MSTSSKENSEKNKLDMMMDWLNDGDPESDCTWVPDGPPPPNTKLGVQEKGKPAPVIPLTKQQLSVLSPGSAPLEQQPEASPLDRSASPSNVAPVKRNVINVTHTSQMSPTLGARPRGLSTASASSYGGGTVPNNSLTSMPGLEANPSLGSLPAASGTYQRPRGSSTASSSYAPGVPNNSLISVPSSILGVPNNSMSSMSGEQSLGSVPSATGFKQRERALSNVSVGAPGVPNNSLASYPSGAVSPPPVDPSRVDGSPVAVGRPRSLSTASAGIPGVPNNSMVSVPGNIQLDPVSASPIQQRPRAVSTASSTGGPGVPNNSMVSAAGFQYEELSMEVPPVGASQVANRTPIQQRPRAVSTASSTGGPGVPNNSMVSAAGFQYEELGALDGIPMQQYRQTPTQQRARAASTASSVGGPQVPNNSIVGADGLLYEMPEVACTDNLGSVSSNALSHEERSGVSMPAGLSASDVIALKAQRNRSTSMASTGSAGLPGVPNNSLASIPGHYDPNSSSNSLPSPITGTSPSGGGGMINSSLSSIPPGVVPNNSLASMPGGLGGVPVSHGQNMSFSFEADGGLRAPQNSVAGSIGMLTPGGERDMMMNQQTDVSPKVLYMPTGKLPGGLEPPAAGPDGNPLQGLPNSGPHSGPESREDSAGCSPTNRSPPNGRLGQDPQQMTSAAYAAIAQLRVSQRESSCLRLELSASQQRAAIERESAEELSELLYRYLKESRHNWDFSSRSAGAADGKTEGPATPLRSLEQDDAPMTEAQRKAVEDSQIEQNNRKLIANDLVKELYESNREMSNQIKEMAMMVVQQQQTSGASSRPNKR